MYRVGFYLKGESYHSVLQASEVFLELHVDSSEQAMSVPVVPALYLIGHGEKLVPCSLPHQLFYNLKCKKSIIYCVLTLMLVVAHFAITKSLKRITETQAHGYSSDSTRESYPMNTNMTWFRWFSKIFASLCFGQKSPPHWKG